MSIVTLADVKSYGNFKTPISDGDLQATIDSAETIAPHWVGPLTSTTITQRFYDATTYLQLNKYPVISVTSVTGSGNSPVDLTTLDIDLDNGTIYPDINGWNHLFPLSRYTVIYQAGWVTVPLDIKLGIMELASYLWKPRSQTRAGADNATPDMTSGPLPPRVRRYWDPYIPLGAG